MICIHPPYLLPKVCTFICPIPILCMKLHCALFSSMRQPMIYLMNYFYIVFGFFYKEILTYHGLYSLSLYKLIKKSCQFSILFAQIYVHWEPPSHDLRGMLDMASHSMGVTAVGPHGKQFHDLVLGGSMPARPIGFATDIEKQVREPHPYPICHNKHILSSKHGNCITRCHKTKMFSFYIPPKLLFQSSRCK